MSFNYLCAQSKTSIISPEGKCFVRGPGVPPSSLLTKRVLANVPLAIIASLPLLDPYELNSRGVSLYKENTLIFFLITYFY